MKRREATEAQKQAAEARRERFRTLAHQVAEMTPEQRDAFAERMGSIRTIEGHPVSLHNTILLSLQSVGAVTIVGGFRQWLEAGRVVRKGEHGLMMWAPRMPAKNSKEEATEPTEAATHERQRFIMVTVFDIAQTAELEAEAPVLAAAS
jgi:hypothetical protein